MHEHKLSAEQVAEIQTAFPIIGTYRSMEVISLQQHLFDRATELSLAALRELHRSMKMTEELFDQLVAGIEHILKSGTLSTAYPRIVINLGELLLITEKVETSEQAKEKVLDAVKQIQDQFPYVAVLVRDIKSDVIDFGCSSVQVLESLPSLVEKLRSDTFADSN